MPPAKPRAPKLASIVMTILQAPMTFRRPGVLPTRKILHQLSLTDLARRIPNLETQHESVQRLASDHSPEERGAFAVAEFQLQLGLLAKNLRLGVHRLASQRQTGRICVHHVPCNKIVPPLLIPAIASCIMLDADLSLVWFRISVAVYHHSDLSWQ